MFPPADGATRDISAFLSDMSFFKAVDAEEVLSDCAELHRHFHLCQIPTRRRWMIVGAAYVAVFGRFRNYGRL